MANPSKFEPNILILCSHWKEKIYDSKQSSFLFNSLFIIVFWIWKSSPFGQYRRTEQMSEHTDVIGSHGSHYTSE